MSSEFLMLLRSMMAMSIFAMGLLSIAAGLWTLLSRDYQQAMKGMTVQSGKLTARAMADLGAVPIIDASARLVDAVGKLVRTAMGVGAFLCILGMLLCVLSFWMFTA